MSDPFELTRTRGNALLRSIPLLPYLLPSRTSWDAPASVVGCESVSIIRQAGLLLPEAAPHRRSSKPLSGLRALDVGCGGGLLSEVGH